jgi:hypothetical protein
MFSRIEQHDFDSLPVDPNRQSTHHSSSNATSAGGVRGAAIGQVGFSPEETDDDVRPPSYIEAVDPTARDKNQEEDHPTPRDDTSANKGAAVGDMGVTPITEATAGATPIHIRSASDTRSTKLPKAPKNYALQVCFLLWFLLCAGMIGFSLYKVLLI